MHLTSQGKCHQSSMILAFVQVNLYVIVSPFYLKPKKGCPKPLNLDQFSRDAQTINKPMYLTMKKKKLKLGTYGF